MVTNCHTPIHFSTSLVRVWRLVLNQTSLLLSYGHEIPNLYFIALDKYKTLYMRKLSYSLGCSTSKPGLRYSQFEGSHTLWESKPSDLETFDAKAPILFGMLDVQAIRLPHSLGYSTSKPSNLKTLNLKAPKLFGMLDAQVTRLGSSLTLTHMRKLSHSRDDQRPSLQTWKLSSSSQTPPEL